MSNVGSECHIDIIMLVCIGPPYVGRREMMTGHTSSCKRTSSLELTKQYVCMLMQLYSFIAMHIVHRNHQLVSPYLEAGILQTPTTTEMISSLLSLFHKLVLKNIELLLDACNNVYAKQLEKCFFLAT